jgi:lipoprotein-anchoring transpeptidase ErfK/SrfK
MPILSRRTVLSGLSLSAACGLAGCGTSRPPTAANALAFAYPKPASKPLPNSGEASDLSYSAVYGPLESEPYPVPPVKLSEIDPAYLRKNVEYSTREAPGTIVIDTRHKYLYHVEDNGRAERYGVGVGREGFGWSGLATVKNKQEWPDWYPPKEMIERQPEIKKVVTELQSGIGMHGGPRNPLGARAMYLWQDNKDTLYRIHGTVEPWTIGKNVSSGCIRMINQDVIDLYERTPVGTKVVVLSA